MVMSTLGIGTVHCEASAAHRIIDKVNIGAAQIINRHLIYNHHDAIRFKGCVHVPDIIIQRLFGLSDRELLIAPNWGLKKSELQYYIDQKLLNSGVVQGSAL